MIVQTITTETMFIEAFREMDRMDNFSIDGLKALYEFLEDLSEDTGEDYELDVVGICCDFSEDSYKDILSSYDLASSEELAELDDAGAVEPESLNDEQMELIIERLNEETIVVYHDDEKVLYQNF